MAQAFEIRGNLCNLCGYQGPDFQLRGHSHPVLYEQEVIGSQRRPVDCPKCKSSDRDRLCFSFLQSTWRPSPNPQILHIAPEKSLSQRILQLLEEKKGGENWAHFQYLGLDKRKGLYRYPSWVQHGDILRLPYDDQSLDLIIANHVLEHIRDLPRALQEIKRVLKPGALLIAQVPWAQKLAKSSLSPKTNRWKRAIWQRKHHGQYDHHWLFGQDLINLMAKENLSACFWTEPADSSLCINRLEPLMIYKA
ncbi:MAG: methyltransferase domain-containing protein [Bacteroidetes bacterium]|nr:methyltransferase domain-containing protein [Bacteroidota bacterium]MDA0942639.1 methyltransferase domain-containing protein [Bacteroidota bacterium]MDA1111947.1 methyltransferase domain-containing protein [Bacteroidota bacterium]